VFITDLLARSASSEDAYESKCSSGDAPDRLRLVLMRINIFMSLFTRALGDSLETRVTTCIFILSVKHLEGYLKHCFSSNCLQRALCIQSSEGTNVLWDGLLAPSHHASLPGSLGAAACFAADKAVKTERWRRLFVEAKFAVFRGSARCRSFGIRRVSLGASWAMA